MKRLLIKNIGQLCGISTSCVALRGEAMKQLESLTDAYLIAEDGTITDFGRMADCPISDGGKVGDCSLGDCGKMADSPEGDGTQEAYFSEVIDARGAIVTPTFCDSHTHIVYAGSREGEFRDKIAGLTYEEIARRGGGILNSADLLGETSEDELFHSAMQRLRQAAAMGTGAIEIKTGYGLTLEGELKMLRVINRMKQAMPQMEIRANFLGAHAVGRAFKGRKDEYVEYVINEMLPAVAGQQCEQECKQCEQECKLNEQKCEQQCADFVDVFCDEGFFTPEDTARILDAAQRYGLQGKIHANELANSGGVQVGVRYNALSVDHLERMGDEEMQLLAASSTVATMLPGCSFFSRMPYAPARQAIDSGCAVALASDWNPGSSPSGSMPFVMSLACIQMRLTPEEAFNASTINGAAALGLAHRYGSIAIGKIASLIIYEPYIPSLAYIPYAYTEPLIHRVILKGE